MKLRRGWFGVLVLVIAAGLIAVSCSSDGDSSSNGTATPGDVTQGVFVHDLLSMETFGVVFAESSERADRAVWRQDGTLRRWDYVSVEHGAPTGGAFIIVNRGAEGTTGQRCLWAQTLDRSGKFYLICGESTRGIGPVLGTWEALLSARADEPIDERDVIGEGASCWKVSDRTVNDGSVCLSADGVPLVLEARRTSHPVTASSFEAIERLGPADIDLSYPVITKSFEGRVDLEQIELPTMFDDP